MQITSLGNTCSSLLNVDKFLANKSSSSVNQSLIKST